MSTELTLLIKHFNQKNALKFAEQLLKSTRLKKPVAEELLALNDSILLEFTRDAIDEYKQSQQGFIFLTQTGADVLKLNKTKNVPTARIRQMNQEVPEESKCTLLKYWPVLDRNFYEKLLIQKIYPPACTEIKEVDAKKIIAKIDSVLAADYALLEPLNRLVTVTPKSRKPLC